MWKIYNLRKKVWGESHEHYKHLALEELGWTEDPCQCYQVGQGANVVRKPEWRKDPDTRVCPKCKKLWSKHGEDGTCPKDDPKKYWGEVYGW